MKSARTFVNIRLYPVVGRIFFATGEDCGLADQMISGGLHIGRDIEITGVSWGEPIPSILLLQARFPVSEL